MLPEPVGRLLRASFFLFHLNHYAKSGERYLYDLKEVVLRSLAEQAGRWQEENMIRIFILPGSERVKLCSRCREKARKMGLNYSEFVRLIGGCRQCPRSAEYYSLYEFLIEYDSYRFCFHIPAELAHNWAGNSSLTMRETPAEREGFMLFGRPAFQAETRAVELTEVIAELRSFLCWLNVLLPRELESLSAVQMDTVFIDLSTFPNCQSRI